MTLLGKIFVMFNLAVSFMMAVAAFGLYATNLDYDSETRSKTGQPQEPARFTAVRKEVEDVLKTKAPVDGSWRNARNALWRRQEDRLATLAWYDKQINHERNLARLPDNPAMMVELRNHLPVPVKPGSGELTMVQALDRDGKTMPSLVVAISQWENAHKDNLVVLEKLRKEMARDKALTQQLTGTAEPIDEESKKDKDITPSVWRIGYRQLLVNERVKREGVESEINSVRPLFINTQVESGLLKQRKESLQERIKELKTYLSRKHKVDVAMRPR
jgi:hypothetical protein